MEDKVQQPAEDKPVGYRKWRDVKHKGDQPTQRTATGLEIPVPKRSEVMDALKKVAAPPKPKP
jgi:hypothetical protein